MSSQLYRQAGGYGWQIIDESYAPIEGLYAIGNNMGGRILQDYPVTIADASHGTCLTFGYVVGKKVASL